MVQTRIITPKVANGFVSRQTNLGVDSYDMDELYSPDTELWKSKVLDLGSPKYPPQAATAPTRYWFDRSRYNNHGTITGAVWKQLSSGTWVLDFDATDDKTVSTFVATLGTIIFWWKPSATINTASAALGIMSFAFTVDENFYIGDSTGALTNETMTLQQNVATSPRCGIISYTFTAETWYHIAWVWDGSAYVPYVNGVAVSTQTSGTPVQITVERFVISDADDGATKLAQMFGGVTLDTLSYSAGQVALDHLTTKWRY